MFGQMDDRDDYEYEPPLVLPDSGWGWHEDMAAVVRQRLDYLDAAGLPIGGFGWAD